jgi:hypothetical protein
MRAIIRRCQPDNVPSIFPCLIAIPLAIPHAVALTLMRYLAPVPPQTQAPGPLFDPSG